MLAGRIADDDTAEDDSLATKDAEYDHSLDASWLSDDPINLMACVSLRLETDRFLSEGVMLTGRMADDMADDGSSATIGKLECTTTVPILCLKQL
jgi:hypothetical protein